MKGENTSTISVFKLSHACIGYKGERNISLGTKIFKSVLINKLKK